MSPKYISSKNHKLQNCQISDIGVANYFYPLARWEYFKVIVGWTASQEKYQTFNNCFKPHKKNTKPSKFVSNSYPL
jgi:hypothetical protein